MVKQRDLLGDADRVVPRQHDHHGAQFGARGLSGHVGEELHSVRAHGVVGKVVFDGPDGVKAEGLSHLGEPQFLAVDLGVRAGVAGVLKRGCVADVHSILLSYAVRFVGLY